MSVLTRMGLTLQKKRHPLYGQVWTDEVAGRNFVKTTGPAGDRGLAELCRYHGLRNDRCDFAPCNEFGELRRPGSTLINWTDVEFWKKFEAKESEK